MPEADDDISISHLPDLATALFFAYTTLLSLKDQKGGNGAELSYTGSII